MSQPQRYDVFIAAVTLRDCQDVRPCIILEVDSSGRVLIAPLSAALQLFNPLFHFTISNEHADFSATGLQRTCYVVGNELRELDVSKMKQKIGVLQGDLKTSFIEWIG